MGVIQVQEGLNHQKLEERRTFLQSLALQTP